LRSPFLGYLFWRSKKGNWPPGHTRQLSINSQQTSAQSAELKNSNKKTDATIASVNLLPIKEITP